MTETETGTALVISADITPSAIFSDAGRVDSIIAEIEKMARAHRPDVSTEKGRKEIASLAYKIARTKTTMDEAGKALNEEARAKINRVDEERRKVRSRLDALRDEVRAPLTKWEEAEQARIERLQDRLAELQDRARRPFATAAEGQALLDDTIAIPIDHGWDEFATDAMVAKDETIRALTGAVARMRQDEADRAELARLRAEQARRDEEEAARRAAEAEAQRQREAEAAEQERIRQAEAAAIEARNNRADTLLKQIAERAEGRINGNPAQAAVLLHDLQNRIPAEMVDLQDRHAHVEMARQHAIEKVQRRAEDEAAEREREQQERAKRAAEEAAEIERQAAAERERQLEAARQDAERRAEEAAERERQRIESERAAEKAAADRRAADLAHRARIRGAISQALEGFTATKENADNLADALMDGRIPHMEVRL